MRVILTSVFCRVLRRQASKMVFVALLTTVMVALTSYLEINLQYLAGPIYNDITHEAFSAAYGRIIIATLIMFAFSATNAGSAWLGKLLSLCTLLFDSWAHDRGVQRSAFCCSDWYQAMVRKAQETYFHKRVRGDQWSCVVCCVL